MSSAAVQAFDAGLAGRNRRVVRRRPREGWGTLLLLLPGCGFLALAMLIPFAQLLLSSLDVAGLGTSGSASLRHYAEIVDNKLFRDSLVFSLYIGLATAALSVALAMAFTAGLQIAFPGRHLVITLYKIPLVVPTLIGAFLMLTMIGPGGMAARALQQLGGRWPTLINDELGLGIIIVLGWHHVPVTVLILSAVAASIPADLVAAARNLGAPPLQVVRKVILPLSMPGVSAAALIVFIDSFGTYAVPSLIGPAHPQAIAVMVTREFLGRAHWGMASALGVAICIATAVVLLLYYRLLLRRRLVAP